MSDVKMTAVRQLSGDYGLKAPGDHFETTEEIAEDLESRGLAVRGHKKLGDSVIEKAEEKRAEGTEAKSTGPAENKAIQPATNKIAAPKK